MIKKLFLMLLLTFILFNAVGCSSINEFFEDEQEDVKILRLMNDYKVDIKYHMYENQVKKIYFFVNQDKKFEDIEYIGAEGTNLDYINLDIDPNYQYGYITYLEECSEDVTINQLNFQIPNDDVIYYVNVLIEISYDDNYNSELVQFPIGHTSRTIEPGFIGSYNINQKSHYFNNLRPPYIGYEKDTLGESFDFEISNINYPVNKYLELRIKYTNWDSPSSWNDLVPSILYNLSLYNENIPLRINQEETPYGTMILFEINEKDYSLRKQLTIIGFDIEYQVKDKDIEYTIYNEICFKYTEDGMYAII